MVNAKRRTHDGSCPDCGARILRRGKTRCPECGAALRPIDVTAGDVWDSLGRLPGPAKAVLVAVGFLLIIVIVTLIAVAAHG